MKLPAYVDIGPHKVQVSTIEMGGDDIGEALTRENRIGICVGMAESQQVETMIHEVTHFLLSGLPLGEPLEECVTIAIARGMTAFLRDNRDLAKQMLEVLEEKL